MSGYSFSFPKLSDEITFEDFCCDLLKIVYSDNSFQLYGKKGSTQLGLDGLNFNSKNNIYFQCKHKAINIKHDVLIKELEEEFLKAYKRIEESSFQNKDWTFILLSTHSRATSIQDKAEEFIKLYKNKNINVLYWGWEDIEKYLSSIYNNDNVDFFEKYFNELSKNLASFQIIKSITEQNFTKYKTDNKNEINKILKTYYKVSDSSTLLFKVIANDLEILNKVFLEDSIKRIEKFPWNTTLWILNNGGTGKTTFLYRLMKEFSLKNEAIYFIDFEDSLEKKDIKNVFNLINKRESKVYFFIDNPYQNEDLIEYFLKEIFNYDFEYKIVFSERGNRYSELENQNISVLAQHQEVFNNKIILENNKEHKKQILEKVIDIFEFNLNDEQVVKIKLELLDKKLGIVESIYRLFLELKKIYKVNFTFDWDEYKNILDKNLKHKNLENIYEYISLLYLFGIRTPLSLLEKLNSSLLDNKEQFIKNFDNITEPIIIEKITGKKIGYQKYEEIIFLRPKHEVVSELYFETQKIDNNDKDIKIADIFNSIDLENNYESNILIRIFGNKRNYNENCFINFNEQLNEIFKNNKLKNLNNIVVQTLHLSRFWSYKNVNNDDKAISCLIDALAIFPKNLHYRTELAKIYQVQKKYKEAEDILFESLKIDDKQLHPRTELAKIYQVQKKYKEAEDILFELLEKDKDNLQARTELAKIYQVQKKYKEAEDILFELLEKDKDNLQARTELAKIYQVQKKYKEAIIYLKEYIKLDTKGLHPRTELAKIYQVQKKYKEAEDILFESLKIDDKQLHPRTELAKIYQVQKKYKEAEDILFELLEKDKDNLQARTELAKIYQVQKKYKEAEDILFELLEKDKDNLQARTELAKIYQVQKKYKEAEDILFELLEKDKDNLQARTELAKIYQVQKKYKEAEDILFESLKIDDKQLHPRTELAKIYQVQKKYKEAEDILRKCIEIDFKDLNSRTELAKIYQVQKKYKEAEDILRKCIEIDFKDLNSRTELAKIYQVQKKYKEAEDILFELLEKDKDNLQARTELAKIYQVQKKYKEAEDILFELLEKDKDNLQARTELAKIYQVQKKYKEAEDILFESLKIDDKQLHPRTELAKIYQVQKKYKEAEDILFESLKIDDKQLHPRTELAKIYQVQKKYKEAEDILFELLKIDSRNFFAMAELIKLYSNMSKIDECLKEVENFINQRNLYIYKQNRTHQPFFNNLFFICKNFNKKEFLNNIFQKYKNNLDERNIVNYTKYLK